jgi:hypothetical protein
MCSLVKQTEQVDSLFFTFFIAGAACPLLYLIPSRASEAPEEPGTT